MQEVVAQQGPNETFSILADIEDIPGFKNMTDSNKRFAIFNYIQKATGNDKYALNLVEGNHPGTILRKYGSW